MRRPNIESVPCKTPWIPLTIKNTSPFRPLVVSSRSQAQFNPLSLDILEFGGLRPPSLRRKYPMTDYPVSRLIIKSISSSSADRLVESGSEMTLQNDRNSGSSVEPSPYKIEIISPSEPQSISEEPSIQKEENKTILDDQQSEVSKKQEESSLITLVKKRTKVRILRRQYYLQKVKDNKIQKYGSKIRPGYLRCRYCEQEMEGSEELGKHIVSQHFEEILTKRRAKTNLK